MSTENTIPQDSITPAQRVRNDWRTLVERLSYKAIVNNIPYIGFITLLCVFYISNSHHAIEMQRDMNKQTKTLKELRWKYTDMKSQLLHSKKEGEIIVNASALGLKPAIMPAYKINDR